MRSQYSEKSQIYYDAAVDLMKGSGYYSPIPHIAYYSCMLRMFHIWYVEKQMSEIYLKILPDGSYTKDVHNQLANQFKLLVIERYKKTDVTKGRIFEKHLGDLKKLRVKADYKNESISSDDSKKAIDLCDVILTILKSLI